MNPREIAESLLATSLTTDTARVIGEAAVDQVLVKVPARSRSEAKDFMLHSLDSYIDDRGPEEGLMRWSERVDAQGGILVPDLFEALDSIDRDLFAKTGRQVMIQDMLVAPPESDPAYEYEGQRGGWDMLE